MAFCGPRLPGSQSFIQRGSASQRRSKLAMRDSLRYVRPVAAAARTRARRSAMDNRVTESGHLMLITPERVFYAGLLGRPRERCPGAFHVYVAIKDGLHLSTADGREAHGELVVTMPNLRHTIASEYRSAICVAIEP